MKKLLLLSFILFYVSIGNSQTTINGSFDHDGITRTYSYYVPASYTPGNEVPLVIGLHGTGSSGSEFAQYRDFRPIADTANFIMVHPDGSTLFGLKFWNYGNILGSTVDDVGFIEALIDTVSVQYSIDPQRVYVTGMSNGSFMSYYLACQSDRFAAIGCVTGSMSTNMYNACTPDHPVPVLHIHGTDDGTNPYEGNTTMTGIEDAVRFWVDQNECDTTPQVTAIPDINSSDGATATRYLYSGGINGHTVEHFKITGGGHSWPGSPWPGSSEVTCMDFDARLEIWRFFSQYELAPASISQSQTIPSLKIWPNPTQDYFYIEQKEGYPVTEIKIIDLQGRVVVQERNGNIQYMDISTLSDGNYIVDIKGDHFSFTQKLLVTGNH